MILLVRNNWALLNLLAPLCLFCLKCFGYSQKEPAGQNLILLMVDGMFDHLFFQFWFGSFGGWSLSLPLRLWRSVVQSDRWARESRHKNFAWSWLKEFEKNVWPNFQNGMEANSLKPVFPTQSYPNWFSLATGSKIVIPVISQLFSIFVHSKNLFNFKVFMSKVTISPVISCLTRIPRCFSNGTWERMTRTRSGGPRIRPHFGTVSKKQL